MVQCADIYPFTQEEEKVMGTYIEGALAKSFIQSPKSPVTTEFSLLKGKMGALGHVQSIEA